MLTDRDKQVLRHIDEYGFITLQQIADLVYNNINTAYDYARRRMKKLMEYNIVKMKKSKMLNINVYYTDNSKSNPSPHRMFLMDYYCKLIKSGANIEEFDIEKEWIKGKYRSDAICVFTLGNTRFYNMIEVNISHNKLKLERFEEPEVLEEFIKEYNAPCLPRLILIDDTEHPSLKLNNLELIRVNYDMSNMSNIFI